MVCINVFRCSVDLCFFIEDRLGANKECLSARILTTEDSRGTIPLGSNLKIFGRFARE